VAAADVAAAGPAVGVAAVALVAAVAAAAAAAADSNPSTAPRWLQNQPPSIKVVLELCFITHHGGTLCLRGAFVLAASDV
jgi:hypothetical protein